jgi:hypothetical protein
MGFPPTPEQQTAIDVFESGDDLVVEAGAGAGKTSTLRSDGQHTEHGRQGGLYLGFNRRIVEEARSVRCPSTSHVGHTACVGVARGWEPVR